jgi:hypothetical protein
MTDTVTISFVLDTTDCSAQLGFEAWVDDNKFFETDHVQGQQKINIEISDDDAEHELRLVMKNKNVDHTKINENNEIIQDAKLVIRDLAFDEIQLGYVFTVKAIYEHDLNGTDVLGQHKFYEELGCNGTVSLKFTTPIYLWILENI